jgi:hypothetical protein
MSGSAHPAEQAEGEGTPLRGSHPNNARNTHLNGSGSRARSDLATRTLEALRGCLRVGPSSSGKHRSTYARVDDDDSSNGLTKPGEDGGVVAGVAALVGLHTNSGRRSGADSLRALDFG